MTAGEWRPDGRHVVRRTRYDVADFEWALGHVASMVAAGDELGVLGPAGSALLADLFAGLHQARPRPVEVVAPDYLINLRIMDGLVSDPRWGELRSLTVGDRFASAIAVARMTPYLIEMFGEVDRVRRASGAPSGPGGARGGFLVEVDPDEADSPVVAQGDLAAALDEATPRIEQTVRQALKAGLDEMRADSSLLAGWSWEPGVVSRLDPAARLALMAELRTDRMLALADMVGNLGGSRREVDRLEADAAESHAIGAGFDLGRILPSELLLLADPATEDEFDRRWAERILAQHTPEAAIDERGGIVYVEDSSVSMKGPPELRARAVGLILLDMAQDQGRPFTALVFAGPGVIERFDFAPSMEHYAAAVIAYARCSILGGGTDFMGALNAALDILGDEHEQSGRTTGEIVFATDGKGAADKRWLAAFAFERGRLGFRTYGICFGPAATEAQSLICDGRVATMDEVGGDVDLLEMFGQLT